jgi:Uma2 family endonuclease
MAVDLKRYRFSRDDYHRMAQTGILPENARVDLIDGEIIEMNPIGGPHMAAIDRLTRIFVRGVGDDTIARIQGSIALGHNGEPEPDLVLLRFREDFYANSPATEEAVLLIVEVADSSEWYDRQTKAPLYARFGIPEYWIVDLNRDRIACYLDPTPTGYHHTRVYRRGESLSPLAFPDLTIGVDEVIGIRPHTGRSSGSER